MYTSNDRASGPTNAGSSRYELHSWTRLAQGSPVVLLSSDARNPRFAGRVDEVSDDGTLMWLIQDNGAGRRLFLRAEGYTTYLGADL